MLQPSSWALAVRDQRPEQYRIRLNRFAIQSHEIVRLFKAGAGRVCMPPIERLEPFARTQAALVGEQPRRTK
jgi:hypothetical protein